MYPSTYLRVRFRIEENRSSRIGLWPSNLRLKLYETLGGFNQ